MQSRPRRCYIGQTNRYNIDNPDALAFFLFLFFFFLFFNISFFIFFILLNTFLLLAQ